ncbi:MAG: aa3-type cytochrome c oxidase subunit IV [Alphaproteobacteria bacterium]|jgi:hypothetical protein|nr:aa3-type cytochrome c oxidase subunit IV [Alphaproteobacteria bacterium]
MGNVAHGDHDGGMDIADQKTTFSGFLAATMWGSALIAMAVAGLVVAFALGAGWFAGVAVYAVLGVLAGAVLRLPGAWWASLAAAVLLFLIGGGIVALAGAMTPS